MSFDGSHYPENHQKYNMGSHNKQRRTKLYQIEPDALIDDLKLWEIRKHRGDMVTRAEQEEAFLLYLEWSRNTAFSAQKAGIPLKSIESKQQTNKRFAERMKEAKARTTGRLEMKSRALAEAGDVGLLKHLMARDEPEKVPAFRQRQMEMEAQHAHEKELASMAADTQLPPEVYADAECMELIEKLNARIEQLTGNAAA